MTAAPGTWNGRPLADYPELLTTHDLADYFGVSIYSIYRRLREGTIPLDPIPTGGRMLFSRFQLERLIRGET